MIILILSDSVYLPCISSHVIRSFDDSRYCFCSDSLTSTFTYSVPASWDSTDDGLDFV